MSETTAGQTKPDVVAMLRDDITAGRLKPNERLVELELVERYAAGRAAVRSALIELAKEGLVERPANRGARVRSIDLATVVEVVETRLLVEGLLASKAAERATSDEIAELDELIRRMDSAVQSGEVVEYSELNRQLHAAIHRLSRHSTASAIVAQLRNQIVRHQFRLALVPGRSTVSLEQHKSIVEAIRAGDPKAAREAMEAHVQSVLDVISEQPNEVWL